MFSAGKTTNECMIIRMQLNVYYYKISTKEFTIASPMYPLASTPCQVMLTSSSLHVAGHRTSTAIIFLHANPNWGSRFHYNQITKYRGEPASNAIMPTLAMNWSPKLHQANHQIFYYFSIIQNVEDSIILKSQPTYLQHAVSLGRRTPFNRFCVTALVGGEPMRMS